MKSTFRALNQPAANSRSALPRMRAAQSTAPAAESAAEAVVRQRSEKV